MAKRIKIQQRVPHLRRLIPRLRHFAEESSRHRNRGLGRQISVRVDVGRDPLGNFLAQLGTRKAAVDEDHESVVRLVADDAPDALGCLPHGIVRAIFLVRDSKIRVHPLEALVEGAVDGRQEGHAEHDDGPTVVAVEIDSFGDFSTRDREEDGAASDVARAAEVGEASGGFFDALRFDEDELQLRQLLQESVAVPF